MRAENDIAASETLTSALVRHVRELRFEDIPSEAVAVARNVFIDGFAAMLSGAVEPLGTGTIVTNYVRDLGGAPQATVVAGGFKTGMLDAAFANGTMAHALDFDNTWYPTNHPTSPTLPAILAAAEHHGSSGRQCVLALVAAFEVQGRLRLASPGLRSGEGFHKPGTTGLMGAVAAGIKLFDLDERQSAMAFGIAGSRAGSLSLNSGTMTKASHSGHAARMGLEAVLLAAKSFTATADIFGPNGFFDCFVGQDQKPALLLEHFAAPLRMIEPGVGFKLYPSNYFTHRAIEAALSIRAQPGFDPADVRSVMIRFPDLRYVDRPNPKSGLDGKFSLQYTTAVALLDGHVGVDSFTDGRRFADDISRLLPLISIEYDTAGSKEFLDMETTITVTSRDGAEFTARIDKLTGMPGVPLTSDQLRQKFYSCAARTLKAPAIDRLFQLLGGVDSLPDVREVMDLVRGDGSIHHAA